MFAKQVTATHCCVYPKCRRLSTCHFGAKFSKRAAPIQKFARTVHYRCPGGKGGRVKRAGTAVRQAYLGSLFKRMAQQRFTSSLVPVTFAGQGPGQQGHSPGGLTTGPLCNIRRSAATKVRSPQGTPHTTPWPSSQRSPKVPFGGRGPRKILMLRPHETRLPVGPLSGDGAPRGAPDRRAGG